MSKVVGPVTIVEGTGGGILRLPRGQLIFGVPRDRGRPHSELTAAEIAQINCEVAAEHSVRILFHHVDSTLSDSFLVLNLFENVDQQVKPIADLTGQGKLQQFNQQSNRRLAVGQLRRVYAEMFVTAVDATANVFGQLHGTLVEFSAHAQAVRDEYARLQAKLPDLAGLRDSIAHKDERLLGRAWKKRIMPEPVDSHDYKGEQIHVSTLDGNTYHNTSAVGRQGRMEVSRQTLETLRASVQATVEAMPWYRFPTQSEMFDASRPTGLVRWQPGDETDRRRNPFAFWDPQ